MAVVLNNQQITDELLALKVSLASMEATLNITVQQMNESIQQSKNMGTEIDNKLRDHITPLVDAKVIDKLTTLNDNHIALPSYGCEIHRHHSRDSGRQGRFH